MHKWAMTVNANIFYFTAVRKWGKFETDVG